MLSKPFFPTLCNNNIAYFDSAASTQTHCSVMNAMRNYYENYRSNSGRGEYDIAEKATISVETARSQVADLINATGENILFTSGATQGLNMVAEWNRDVPVVIITEAEHNANIVPWLAQGRTQQNGKLVVIPVESNGRIDFHKAAEILNECPVGSLFSFCATSNVTGITHSWEKLSELAQYHGITVCVDFSQTVAHEKIDLGNHSSVSWAVFSAHKMYGPTGIGALYTAFNLDILKPLQHGGGCVSNVTFNDVSYASGLDKHQCGTQNIAGIIGFGVAAELINYVSYNDIKIAERYVEEMLIMKGLYNIHGLRLADNLDYETYSNIKSFVPINAHSSDIATLMSRTNSAVRCGRVCAHPYVDKISNKKGIVRVSFAPYNTEQDCEMLVNDLASVMKILN